MENQFIFQLLKGSSKTMCPNCNKKTFVQYENTITNELLPELFGRCDREVNCAYHLNPYKENYNQGLEIVTSKKVYKKQQIKTYIPLEILLKLREKGRLIQNVFLQNLINKVPFPFDINDIEEVNLLYSLGTIIKGEYSGAITFPFIDFKRRVHAIQVKKFDENNNTINTNFIHKVVAKEFFKNNMTLPTWIDQYDKNEKKVSCLFGEHLIDKYPENPIALVEAPKTAIYGTLYFGFPKYRKNLLWLAVYNLSSLNYEKCKILEGRNIYLFPDLSKDGSAFELWHNKAKELQSKIKGTRFIISDLLEKNASYIDRLNGNDLADFLIKQDWRKFRNPSV